jgi:predicted dehydrogenase
VKIGFCGLALSHPYTFAERFLRLGVDRFVIWDTEAERVDRFRERHPTATVVDDPEAMAAAGVDGVMVCSETVDHLAHARVFLERDVPTFVDKPLVTTQSDLEGFDAVAHLAPLWCASVLRFAPALRAVIEKAVEGELGDVTHVETVIDHTIAPYLVPGNTWQDEPDRGGGTIATMGAHGMELIAAVCAPFRPEGVFASARRVRHHTSRSEDTAHVVLDLPDGPLASIALVGAADVEPSYALTVHGSVASATAVVPGSGGDDPDFGYDATAQAFLGMLRDGKAPVPWDEVRAISAALLAARRSSTDGHPARVELPASSPSS